MGDSIRWYRYGARGNVSSEGANVWVHGLGICAHAASGSAATVIGADAASSELWGNKAILKK